MRISATLALAGATSVLANCYGGGVDWASQKAMALNKAQEVCKLKYSQKSWASKDIIGACYNLDSDKKVDFVLERISDGDDLRDISPEECYDGFQKEINGCKHGGVTGYINWKYT